MNRTSARGLRRAILAAVLTPLIVALQPSESPKAAAPPPQSQGIGIPQRSAPVAPEISVGPIAICLSGGGAKGDFEVGALRYLYNRQIRPDIITGTSVGAINGAKLAEGEGSANQGLAGLERIWLSLRTGSDMFLPEPWLDKIDPDIRAFVEERGAGSIEGPEHVPGLGEYDPFAFVYNLASDIVWLFSDGRAILEALQQLFEARALYNLDPIRWKIYGDAAHGVEKQFDERKVLEWSQGGRRKLRLAAVSLESGKLRYVTESGDVLERDNSQRATYHVGFVQACDPIQARVNEIDRLRRDLTNAPPTARTELLRQIRAAYAQLPRLSRELEDCLREHPEPPAETRTPVRVTLGAGILGSAAMAGIFVPEPFGSGPQAEHYVDGGHREFVPVQVAVDSGARTIYAIATSALGLAPKHVDLTGLGNVARALMDIAIDEIYSGDITPTSSWDQVKVRHIVATQSLHDFKTIDPGLIRIAMNYGYMRAADVMESVRTTEGELSTTGQTRVFPSPLGGLRPSIGEQQVRDAFALSDRIAQLRRDNRQDEKGYFGAPRGHEDRTRLAQMQDRKRQILDLTRRRISMGYSIPPTIERAWINWEWNPDVLPPALWPGVLIGGLPADCQRISTRLQAIERELDRLSEERRRHESDRSESPSLTPAQRERERQLRGEHPAARTELRNCLWEHSIPPLRDPLWHGLVVTSDGTRHFVIYGGSKIALPNGSALAEMGYSPTNVVRVPQPTLDGMPTNLPADGTLVKSRAETWVYVMMDGRRRRVANWEVFDRHGFNAWEIRILPPDSLAGIPSGPDLTE